MNFLHSTQLENFMSDWKSAGMFCLVNKSKMVFLLYTRLYLELLLEPPFFWQKSWTVAQQMTQPCQYRQILLMVLIPFQWCVKSLGYQVIENSFKYSQSLGIISKATVKITNPYLSAVSCYVAFHLLSNFTLYYPYIYLVFISLFAVLYVSNYHQMLGIGLKQGFTIKTPFMKRFLQRQHRRVLKP